MNDNAKKARNEYMRAWRRRNKDKVKRNQESYWQRKAKEKIEEGGNIECQK